MNRLLWITLGISSLVAVPFALGDWPMFRGPAANGLAIDSKLPTQWSQTENVVWKQPIPGKGWSSPVIGGGRIYLSSAVPVGSDEKPDYSLRLIGLEASSGKTIFDTEIFLQEGSSSPRIHRKNSHASPTPILAGDRLFVHFGHQGTACVDTQGNIIWKTQELRYSPVHGAGGSPMLVDGLLIFSCDGGSDPFIAALDAESGQVAWKVPRESDAAKKFSFTTPAVITVNGQKQLISPGSNVVNSLDPKTGKEIWRARYDGYSVIPQPVFGHGLVFVCTGYERPTVIAIRPDGQGDVTDTHVEWTLKDDAPHTPSPLLVGDELYMVSDNGIASCVDARTGKKIWKKRLGGNYSASPISANNLIYFQSEEGTTTIIKVGKEFELVAKIEMDEPTLASHAVNGKQLFLRTDKHLYCLAESSP